jgi:Domain of unknown function (DUF4281)
MATAFDLGNVFVLPFWFLMIVLPHWRWTQRLMHSPLISGMPAALYTCLVVSRLGEVWPAVANPKLPEIAALLGSPAGATIAWAHFLAFDLLVGRWMYLESRERAISAWLMAPLLFLTLMLGPLGFLLYLIVRVAFGRRNNHAHQDKPVVASKKES